MPFGKSELQYIKAPKVDREIQLEASLLKSSQGQQVRSNLGSFKAESEKLRGVANHSNRSNRGQSRESELQSTSNLRKAIHTSSFTQLQPKSEAHLYMPRQANKKVQEAM